MPEATIEAPADRLLTPAMIRDRLGYSNVRKVWELISPETYGKSGPPELAAINMRKPGERKNRWRVHESELNRYIASLQTNA